MRNALAVIAVLVLGACGTAPPSPTPSAASSVATLALTGDGAYVTFEDPTSVISSGTIVDEGFDFPNGVEVSNPSGDPGSLQLTWPSAMCAPGARFRISPEGAGWLLDAQALQVRPPGAPTGGPSCAGGQITIRIRLSLARPISAAQVRVVGP